VNNPRWQLLILNAIYRLVGQFPRPHTIWPKVDFLIAILCLGDVYAYSRQVSQAVGDIAYVVSAAQELT